MFKLGMNLRKAVLSLTRPEVPVSLPDKPIVPQPPSTDRLWRPNLIVFVSNACIMTVELVAGRIVAPYIGVSLYTWTSVIGVVLAGISLGNYLGGRLADRYASRRLLGAIFILAGLTSLSILGTTALMSQLTVPAPLPLILRVVLYVAAIFFVPSAALGAISPVVVKLTLQDLTRTGNVVGQIYAYSALGSILGTFATGFFLIAWFGTRTIVLAVGILLIVMGLVLGRWANGRRSQAILAGVAVAGLLVVPSRVNLGNPCLRETNYFCIKVREQELEDGSTVRLLILDRLVHSYTSLDDPTKLVYGYEKVYAEVAEYVARRRPNFSAMFIGGGGYTFPRFLEAVYPQTDLEVVEIDPQVTAVAHEYLGLSPQTRVHTFNQDARLFLIQLDPARRYDMIIGDAFNDYSVPYHLTTREFNELVRVHLADDGIYLVNLVDGRRRLFLDAYLRTLRLTFPYVYVVPSNLGWEESPRSTFVVVASPAPMDLNVLTSLDGGDGVRQIKNWLLPAERLEALLAEGAPTLLVDDHVPVDNLLAPVFEDSERNTGGS